MCVSLVLMCSLIDFKGATLSAMNNGADCWNSCWLFVSALNANMKAVTGFHNWRMYVIIPGDTVKLSKDKSI